MTLYSSLIHLSHACQHDSVDFLTLLCRRELYIQVDASLTAFKFPSLSFVPLGNLDGWISPLVLALIIMGPMAVVVCCCRSNTNNTNCITLQPLILYTLQLRRSLVLTSMILIATLYILIRTDRTCPHNFNFILLFRNKILGKVAPPQTPAENINRRQPKIHSLGNVNASQQCLLRSPHL